jgi:exonuclease VII small subunit
MIKEKKEVESLSNNLKRLAEITAWFDAQEAVDVEEGLNKVKEAVSLIKACKERLRGVENEFEEIQKELGAKEGE